MGALYPTPAGSSNPIRRTFYHGFRDHKLSEGEHLMAMTRAQVETAVADFIARAKGQDGGFRLISDPVVNAGAHTVSFKISVPAGDPLTGVGETVQTVTLTVAIS